jgi:hypothetical protein
MSTLKKLGKSAAGVALALGVFVSPYRYLCTEVMTV